MKIWNRVISAVCCMAFLATAAFGLVSCGDPETDKNGNVKLTIEASGQNTSYKTTRSMTYDKDMNPYPYNTLEVLVKAWNEMNADTYGYFFSVSSTDINNDRQTLIPMYDSKSAPEIHYYQPTTIAEDQDKGYFYDLSEVMNTPNKYSKEGEAGSVAWKDIYSAEEYNTFFAPNGKLFTVPMEQNPIGLLYNKTLLTAAGVTKVPTTYKEFMEAQDKLHAYAVSVGRANTSDVANYITPYYTIDSNWYDLYLEGAINSGLKEQLDVIRADGRIDAEEFVRGYQNNLFSPKSDAYAELYRLIVQMCKYYPSGNAYEAEKQFLAGNIGMIEVTGGYIHQLIDEVDGKFDLGIMPFPKLETQPSGAAKSDYYTTVKVTGNVRGGLSGYSTGWAISNAAMARDEQNGNTKCVDACVDLLMYLSCYENNDKMVNDKGFAIPLSGNTTYANFTSLANAFKADAKKSNSIAWGATSLGGAMTKDFYDASVLRRKSIVNASISDRDNGTSNLNIKSELENLYKSFSSAANYLYRINKWDKSSWPKA